jgi:hypothetical protein
MFALKLRLQGIVLLLGLASATTTAAEQAVHWPVQSRLLGKNGKASTDISGIACSTIAGFPRRCLVIDDNLQAAQQVTLHEGRLEAGQPVPLIDNSWHGKPLELDGEGVAFADGVFYVIGSHGHPRDAHHKLDPVVDHDLIEARIAATSQIVPLRLKPDGTLMRLPVLTLSGAIAAQPDLRSAAGQRLDANGVTIEGIAVKGDRLLAGFRGPSLPGGRAALLDVSLSALRAGNLATSRLFKLPLGQGQGVRDLAPLGSGFLVLAGPIENGSGRYELFAWDGASDEGVKSLGDISQAAMVSKTRKPEAVLPLDDNGPTIRVLILFDGPEQGDPTVLTVRSP